MSLWLQQYNKNCRITFYNRSSQIEWTLTCCMAHLQIHVFIVYENEKNNTGIDRYRSQVTCYWSSSEHSRALLKGCSLIGRLSHCQFNAAAAAVSDVHRSTQSHKTKRRQIQQQPVLCPSSSFPSHRLAGSSDKDGRCVVCRPAVATGAYSQKYWGLFAYSLKHA